MATDEQIFQDFKANRLDSLYESVYPSLMIFANTNLTGDFAFLAEDCVQDAIFAAYQNRSSIHTFYSLKSFLYTCVKNSAISILRKARAKENYLSGEEYIERDMFEEISRAETRRKLFSAVSRLPEKYRQVFDMSFSQGLKNSEVAQALGLSISGVKKQKAKIKLLLHDEVKGPSAKIFSAILLITYYIIS